MTEKKFGWYDSDYSEKKASTRIRVLKPIAELKKRGINIGLIHNTDVSHFDTVILSKIYGKNAVEITKNALTCGIPVVMDVCDNILERAERRGQTSRLASIESQLRDASLITVPTNDLMKIFIDRLPELASKIQIVPDMLESLPISRSTGIFHWYRIKRIESFLSKNDNMLHCVWFGKSSGIKSGISHLDLIMPEMERYNKKFGLTLTIISNKRMLYRKVSRKWNIPHFYIDWKLGDFDEILRKHHVAVIPIGINDYTFGKTINRPATALMSGVGVIASSIPSYEELRDFIYINEWDKGFLEYGGNWNEELVRIERAQDFIQKKYDSSHITDAWLNILQSI